MKRPLKSVFQSIKFRIILISLAGVAALLLTVFGYVFPLYTESYREGLKHEVRSAVDIAYSNIEFYQKKIESKELTKDQAMQLAKESSRNLRFNATDYFFIYDENGLTIMHPINKDYEGTNRIEVKDPNGIPLVRNMIAIAKSSEGFGFTEYSVSKVKGGVAIPKTTYVRNFKPWGWVIASGIYSDVVEAKIASLRHELIVVFAMVTLLVIIISLWFSIRFSNKMGQVILSAGSSANILGTTSESLASASQDLASSSQEQAAAVEQVSASLEQITAMVESTLSYSKDSVGLSEKVRDLVQSGDNSMKLLQTAVAEIANSNDRIERLAVLIAEIGEKTILIDEIVFQTKLLSFNASIEAERAGEHGRGFAVVAQEVGNLAQMSGKSAIEIGQIVKNCIREANDAAQENRVKVKEGAIQCEETAKSLRSIQTASSEILSGSQQILKASAEQNSGIQQINQSLNLINQAVQEMASSAETCATGSSSLVEQGTSLNSVISGLEVLVHGQQKAS